MSRPLKAMDSLIFWSRRPGAPLRPGPIAARIAVCLAVPHSAIAHTDRIMTTTLLIGSKQPH